MNFFDCADAYSGGEAERFLGRCLKDYPRSKLVISSKVFFPSGSGANEWGLSRKHIFEQVDKSLKNMQVDYLDMYFCHRFDPTTPIEETMRALDDLVHQGKILYYGVSEWSPVQITKALGIIRELHLYPMTVLQPQYNMVDRYVEDEIFDLCKENGAGHRSLLPAGAGAADLASTARDSHAGGLPRHASGRQADQQPADGSQFGAGRQLAKVADGLGIPMSVMALAWTLRDRSSRA